MNTDLKETKSSTPCNQTCNNTHSDDKERNVTDSFDYVWRTYRGRKVLSRRWTQTAKETCKDCGKRHKYTSELIIGTLLTKEIT